MWCLWRSRVRSRAVRSPAFGALTELPVRNQSPAGVGFSASDNSTDYNTDDAQTTADTLAFYHGLFAKHPYLSLLDVYLAGVSYGGHYVPDDALSILKNNRDPTRARINLKGLMIGNPYTDPAYDDVAWFNVFAEYGVMSEGTTQRMLDACVPTVKREHTPECDEAKAASEAELGPVDPYSLFEDVCVDNVHGTTVA